MQSKPEPLPSSAQAGLVSRLKARLTGSEFSRSTLKIAGGTALGQGLVAAATPFLTRLYAPADFGLQAVYVSILSILVVVASLRLELAVPLPKYEREAAHLLLLALLAAAVFSGLTVVGCLLFGQRLLQSIHAPGLQPFLVWVLPIGVLGAGSYQAMSYWAIRKRDYDRLARTRWRQGLAQVIAQIGLGFLPFGPLGLLVGADVGRINGTGMLVRSAWQEEREHFRSFTWRELRGMASRYRNFPLVSTWSALLNAMALFLPAILITAIFDAQVSGQFALGQRIVGLPMALIGQAIAQVYTAECAALLREHPERLNGLFKRTMRKLFLAGALPLLALALMGPQGFRWMFGPKWGMAGLFVRILAPVYLLQLVASSLSQTMAVLERQKLQFIWDSARVIAVVVAIVIPARMGLGIVWITSTFGIAMGLLYLGLLWLLHRETMALTGSAHV